MANLSLITSTHVNFVLLRMKTQRSEVPPKSQASQISKPPVPVRETNLKSWMVLHGWHQRLTSGLHMATQEHIHTQMKISKHNGKAKHKTPWVWWTQKSLKVISRNFPVSTKNPLVLILQCRGWAQSLMNARQAFIPEAIPLTYSIVFFCFIWGWVSRSPG